MGAGRRPGFLARGGDAGMKGPMKGINNIARILPKIIPKYNTFSEYIE
jgi:hypothetical protein